MIVIPKLKSNVKKAWSVRRISTGGNVDFLMNHVQGRHVEGLKESNVIAYVKTKAKLQYAWTMSLSDTPHMMTICRMTFIMMTFMMIAIRMRGMSIV